MKLSMEMMSNFAMHYNKVIGGDDVGHAEHQDKVIGAKNGTKLAKDGAVLTEYRDMVIGLLDRVVEHRNMIADL